MQQKGYTFWEKDFDGMAYKTMLRQLISKWGIMSIDMQNAMESDMAVIHEDGTKDYVDTVSEENIVSRSRILSRKRQRKHLNQKNRNYRKKQQKKNHSSSLNKRKEQHDETY